MSPVTDPFSADTPDLLTRSLSHVAAARLVMPDGETVALDMVDGSLSWDERRSPRVDCQLDVRLPTDAAQLSRIDPRTGARLVVDAGYVRPGGARDVQTIANLSTRTRRVLRPADRTTLVARSDESLVIDTGADTGPAVTGATTTATITSLIQQVFPGTPVTVSGPAGPAVTTEAYADRWDRIADLADRIGAQVYDDGLRAWKIAPAPALGTVVADLAVGATGTITDSAADLTRDGDGEDSSTWANAVVLVHEWVDGTGATQRITSRRRVTTGPYAAVTGNTKVLRVDRQSQISQANADVAAASLVARTVTRGRTLTLTAVSAYWLRPGHTVTVTLPTGGTETHLVVAVTFDLRAGLMDVTTRLPDNTGTIGA